MSLHITAKPGEIAERVLLPGDPLRARYIAERFLEDALLVNELRGALCYTGRYKGLPVSVMGTGMGIPSIMIYATELCRDYNAQKLIRLGTGASFTPKLKKMDIALSMAASHTSAINEHIFPGTFAPTADFTLLDTAYHKAREMGINALAGNTLCYDLLYRDDRFFSLDTWRQYGVIAGEMEAAGLYTVAAQYGRQALAMLTVVVELTEGLDVTGGHAQTNAVDVKARERGLDAMIALALETVIE